MDRSSDNESESSFPELLSRDQIVDLYSDDVLTRRQNGNNYNIDQRFNEINRQIGDLTNIVLTLTNQFASVNGEGNRLNPATTSTDNRSDIFSLVLASSSASFCSLDLSTHFRPYSHVTLEFHPGIGNLHCLSLALFLKAV